VRRERKKQATRDRLIRAALELFGSQGYEQTTVQQITQRAGVAKGTFFNYFASKEEVLRNIGSAQEEWALDELANLHQDSEGPLTARLTAFMVTLGTRLPFTPHLMRALCHAILASSAEMAGDLGTGQGMVRGLTPIFAAGQERGEFTRTFPAERLAHLATQNYFGVLFTWAINPAPCPLGDAVKEGFQVFFHGVAQPPSERGIDAGVEPSL
jgi:AcrR family transcriptional regulator